MSTAHEFHDTLYGPPSDADLAELDWAEGDARPVPENADGADRQLRLAARARAELERLVELYDAQIEHLTARKAEATAGLFREVERRLELVEVWHRTEHRAGRVGKTVKLPHGTSKLTKAQPTLEVVDDEFRAWAEAEGRADLLLPPKPAAPSLSALRKAAAIEAGEPGSRVRLVDKDTGVPIPGVVAVHRHDHYNATPGA